MAGDRVIIAALVTQVCLYWGCNETHKSQGRPPASRPDGPRQSRPIDAIRVQVDYLPPNLNPLLSQDFWTRLIAFRTIFEPLVVVTASGAYQPFLAHEIATLDHGRRFRLKLRENVRFHDRRPLTSADVKYTLETMLKRARKERGSTSLLHAELGQLVEVRTLGDHQVELVLRRRNHLFPSVLADLPILPAHLYHRRGLANPQLNRAPVGTGPFRLEPPGRSATRLTLVRDESYWGRRAAAARLVFDVVSDPAKALAQLRNGELDIIPTLHPAYYPDQVQGERMKRRFQAIRIHPYRMRLMLFNVRQGPLKDRRVRLALAQLTDRPRLVREIRHNLGQVVSAPVWPLSSWYDSSVPHPHEYDRAAAARLLDAAGWTRAQPGKVRRKQGHPLRLRLLLAREAKQMVQAAAQLKAEFWAAGVQLEVRVGDFGFVKSQLRRGRFDIALIGLAPRPESDLSPVLHSQGQLNLGGYDNPTVDRLLDAVRATPPEGDRLRVLRQLYRALHEDPPFLILYAPIQVMVVARSVGGLANNGRWPVLAGLRR